MRSRDRRALRGPERVSHTGSVSLVPSSSVFNPVIYVGCLINESIGFI